MSDLNPLFASLVSLAALLGLAGCQQDLPDAKSPGAQVYRERCSGCHAAYPPSAMKPALWRQVLVRMERNVAQTSRGPLTPEEKRMILEYLDKHAQ